MCSSMGIRQNPETVLFDVHCGILLADSVSILDFFCISRWPQEPVENKKVKEDLHLSGEWFLFVIQCC